MASSRRLALLALMWSGVAFALTSCLLLANVPPALLAVALVLVVAAALLTYGGRDG